MRYNPAITIVFVVLLFVFIAGCTSSSGTSDNSPTAKPTSPPASTATPVITAAPTPTAVPEPSPISLSGTGQQASQKFSLGKGLSIFTMKHTGSSNFAIWLLDSNGKHVDLLVNEIGSFDGSKVEGITTAGDYLLDISADGPWTVDVTQPRPVTAQGTPVSLSGVGQKVSQFVSLKSGLVTFKMTHDGDSNFAIWLDDANGKHVDLLVNEIGSFDGSKAEGITKSGIYVLDISADGNWKVDIS